MQPLIDQTEAARRVRAAIAYDGREHSEIAAAAGLSISMLRRISSRTSPRDGTIDRLRSIADACGVPAWFMEHGFNALQQTVDPVLADDLHRLEEMVTQMHRALAAAGIAMPEPRAGLTRALGEEQQMRREAPDDEAQGEAPGRFG